MEIKYEKVFTDGPKHTWERTATIDGKRLWDEKWCKDCDCWRRVKYFCNERLCAVCEALDEWRSFILFEDYHLCIDASWEYFGRYLLPSKPLNMLPAKCACGRLGESCNPLYWRCESCEELVQETEQELRR